jgi:hypothetical protein
MLSQWLLIMVCNAELLVVNHSESVVVNHGVLF